MKYYTTEQERAKKQRKLERYILRLQGIRAELKEISEGLAGLMPAKHYSGLCMVLDRALLQPLDNLMVMLAPLRVGLQDPADPNLPIKPVG